jgi:hypothetical protein
MNKTAHAAWGLAGAYFLLAWLAERRSELKRQASR